MSESRFIVGLDVGATTALLRAACLECRDTVELRGGGANPSRVGVEETASVMIDLIDEARQRHRHAAHVSVVAGVAGAGRFEMKTALTKALRTGLSTNDTSPAVEVVTDAEITLDAAYEDGSGVIVIAGTGSMVLARSEDGTVARAGGWGAQLGDAGSGHALGRAGLRAVAECFDGGSGTTLTNILQAERGIASRDDLLRAVYAEDVDVASIAPLVVAAAADGDSVAAGILDAEVRRLAEQVDWVCRRAGPMTRQITLVGGLLRNDFYQQCLRGAVQETVGDWPVEILEDEPVAGALRRARGLTS